MYKTRANRASCSPEAAGRDEDGDMVMRAHCTVVFCSGRHAVCVCVCLQAGLSVLHDIWGPISDLLVV